MPRCAPLAISLLALSLAAYAQPAPGQINVRDFGAVGDGVTDDTAALEAAFAAAEKRTISWQPITGQCYVNSLPEVYFPNGRYRLSAPLKPRGHLVGEGNAILEQPDPTVDIIQNDWAWRWRVSGLTFLGGRHQLNIGNANIDTGRIVIDHCVFQNAAGVAVKVGDQSFSTLLTISNSLFITCDQALVTYCDMTKMSDCWITSSPAMKEKAVIENHGGLVCEHICGVPMVTPENDQRWIDNYGSVTCRNFRFGGEFAGFTAVVNRVRYDHEYPVVPSFIIMEACQCYCLGNRLRNAFIYCEEIPNQIVVRDCTGFPDLPVLRVSEQLDLDTYFDDAEVRGEACLRFFIGPEQVELRLRDLPEQMRPYQVGDVTAAGPPQKGIWPVGAFLRNRQAGPDEPWGWRCVEGGRPGKWVAVASMPVQ